MAPLFFVRSFYSRMIAVAVSSAGDEPASVRPSAAPTSTVISVPRQKAAITGFIVTF